MSEDKRRYVSKQQGRNRVKPIAPTDGKLVPDGYQTRHRENFNRKRDAMLWNKETDVSPGLRDEQDIAFDSYMMD
jgi:hypothetical protein